MVFVDPSVDSTRLLKVLMSADQSVRHQKALKDDSDDQTRTQYKTDSLLKLQCNRRAQAVND
eukprot:scaffold6052_cov118-Cylindrotheca_fusiformis.AAC.12